MTVVRMARGNPDRSGCDRNGENEDQGRQHRKLPSGLLVWLNLLAFDHVFTDLGLPEIEHHLAPGGKAELGWRNRRHPDQVGEAFAWTPWCVHSTAFESDPTPSAGGRLSSVNQGGERDVRESVFAACQKPSLSSCWRTPRHSPKELPRTRYKFRPEGAAVDTRWRRSAESRAIVRRRADLEVSYDHGRRRDAGRSVTSVADDVGMSQSDARGDQRFAKGEPGSGSSDSVMSATSGTGYDAGEFADQEPEGGRRAEVRPFRTGFSQKLMVSACRELLLTHQDEDVATG